MQFVRSARGVYPVAKTFGKDWVPGNRFKVWRDKWENGLTNAERTLWNHVQERYKAAQADIAFSGAARMTHHKERAL